MKVLRFGLVVISLLLSGCSGTEDASKNTQKPDLGASSAGSSGVRSEKEEFAKQLQEMIALFESGDAEKVFKRCMPPKVYEKFRKSSIYPLKVAKFREQLAPVRLKLLRSIDLNDVVIDGDEIRLPDVKLPSGVGMGFLRVDGQWYLTTIDALPSRSAELVKESHGPVVFTWEGGEVRAYDLAAFQRRQRIAFEVYQRILQACDKKGTNRWMLPPLPDMSEEAMSDKMFLVFLADEYGVAFKDSAIVNYFQAWCGKSLDRGRVVEIIRSVAKDRHVNDSELIVALSDQAKIAWSEMIFGVGSCLGLMTPSEMFLQYERTNRRIDLELIEFPVADYVNQVAEEPSEEKLEQLYAKYSERLPDPYSPDPAFKCPHQCAFEGVVASVKPIKEKGMKILLPDFESQEKPESPDPPEDSSVQEQEARKHELELMDKVFASIERKHRDYLQSRIRWIKKADPSSPEPSPPKVDAMKLPPGYKYFRIPLGDKFALSESEVVSLSPQQIEQLFTQLPYRPMRLNWMGQEILCWKTEEVEEHVPTFEEARKKMVRTCKLDKAREVVRDKIKRLAQEASRSPKPLKEQFGDAYPVSISDSCSYYISQPYSIPGYGPPPLSRLPHVKLPGKTFHDRVFRMEEGEVAPLLNVPQTHGYLVRVKGEEFGPKSNRPVFLAGFEAQTLGGTQDDVDWGGPLLRNALLERRIVASQDLIKDIKAELEVQYCAEEVSAKKRPKPPIALPEPDEMWGEVLLAMQEGDEDWLQQIADTHKNSEIGLWAKLLLTNVQLAKTNYKGALLPNTPNPDKKKKSLTEAANAYRLISEKASRPLLRDYARLGLARVLECSNQIEEAKKIYKQLADPSSSLPPARIARAHFDNLDRQVTQEFYAWFFTQEWKPRNPLSPDEMNLPNFDDPLPEIPSDADLPLPKVEKKPSDKEDAK